MRHYTTGNSVGYLMLQNNLHIFLDGLPGISANQRTSANTMAMGRDNYSEAAFVRLGCKVRQGLCKVSRH